MTATFIPVDPFDLVVFGGTGDLAMRKILPGLYQRDLDGQLPAESRIVGAARTEIDRDGYVAQAEKALRRFVEPERLHEEKLASFLARLDYLPLDATRESGWLDLAGKLGDAPDRIRVFYLATAPDSVLMSDVLLWGRRDPVYLSSMTAAAGLLSAFD